MPPKIKISRENILDKAVDIAREQGIEAVNARSLAAKLGCSVQPIFRAFDSMGDLRGAIVKEATREYKEYMLTAVQGESSYRATGTNYIRFAKEQPHLFRLLFMTSRQDNLNIAESTIDETKDYVISTIKENYKVTDEAALKIYIDMWLFSHGIATMLATKTTRLDDKQISQMFTDVFLGLLKELGGTLK